MRKYDLAVCVGRFQPFHNGHKYLIEEALKLAEEVLVLVGSANKSVSIKNPFTYQERKDFILNSFMETGTWTDKPQYNQRIKVKPLKDVTYNDEKWIAQVHQLVSEECARASDRVVLVGHKKDHTSWYLNEFSNWAYEEVGYSDKLNATNIRDLIFSGHTTNYVKGVMPPHVWSYINGLIEQGELDNLFKEWKYIQNYKQSWAAAPFPPIFMTVDSVVIQQGHVLLVQRRGPVGANLWALPGGHLEQNEFTKDGALRELKEETQIHLQDIILERNIVTSKLFDAPGRSLVGRMLTNVFLIHLQPSKGGLPKVKAADDAKDCKWTPLADLKEEEMFDDHFQIIQKMIDCI